MDNPLGGGRFDDIVICHLVSYLTPVSDLDLAPPTDQFVASPPVRYINPGCCVKIMCLLQRCPRVAKI